MIFGVTFFFAILPTLALSAPAAPAGSKHNVYLVHCEPNECPIGSCDPGDFTITAAAYFRNGPIAEGTTSRVQTPTTLARLNGDNTRFEGSRRTFRFGSDGTFTTNIPASARTAASGSIAGDATLGEEPFVCFKDGKTKFQINNDDERYTCTTDYWCASTDTSTPTKM